MNKVNSSAKIPFIRTPDENFHQLKDYPFKENYFFIDGLRMHYVDENPKSKRIVVLLHGEPTWSYSYRKIITVLAKEGYRVIAPDLIGFGKSDKPINKKDYSYKNVVSWIEKLFFTHLNLEKINLIVHDWGGIIGLRILATHPEKFSSVVAMNTAFPRLEGMNVIFSLWRLFSPLVLHKPLSKLILFGIYNKNSLNKAELEAFDAPFPTYQHKKGAITYPKLVPIYPWDMEVWKNRTLWKKLVDFDKPFLTIYSDKDPFTKRVEQKFIKEIKGAKNQKHIKIKNAGHFLHEDKPEEVIIHIVDFLNKIQ